MYYITIELLPQTNSFIYTVSKDCETVCLCDTEDEALDCLEALDEIAEQYL